MPANDELSSAKAAKIIGVSAETVRRWCDDRQLAHVRVGPIFRDKQGRDRRAIRIPRTEVYRMRETVPRVA